MHFYKIIYLLLVLLVVSCKKEVKQEESVAPPFFSNGLLVVNEGLFQQNNASLSWVNGSTNEVNSSIFEQKTNRQLGDVANDILKYGSKIYVIVSVSSTVEVLDANSGSPLQQILMQHNGIGSQPRFAVASNGKVFVSCFDGNVSVIDTTNLSIQSRIAVGANPDGIHLANGKIYVANSGGLSYPNVDSTLSVIDPISLTETNRIVVGKNPTRVTSDPSGNLYIITQTGLNSLTNRLVKLDGSSNSITAVYNWNVLHFTPIHSKMLLHIVNGTTSSLQLFDTMNGEIENNNFIAANQFSTFYGAQFDATTNKLYCFDAKNYVNTGFVRIFSSNGSYVQSINVGLNPSKLLIYE